MKQMDYILANETEVLKFLKSQYPMYHLSNFFFRDIQYGIQTMLDRKNMPVGYADAEKIARAFVSQLEKKKILNPIDQQSWVVNYPEFRKPSAKPAGPAKPAAKPAAPAPAVAAPGAAKPSLPPLSRPAAKPGGLPPLKSTTATARTATPTPQPPQPAAQAEGSVPVASTRVAEAAEPATPTPPAAKPVAPGQRKPLPPLKSSTPAGKK